MVKIQRVDNGLWDLFPPSTFNNINRIKNIDSEKVSIDGILYLKKTQRAATAEEITVGNGQVTNVIGGGMPQMDKTIVTRKGLPEAVLTGNNVHEQFIEYVAPFNPAECSIDTRMLVYLLGNPIDIVISGSVDLKSEAAFENGRVICLTENNRIVGTFEGEKFSITDFQKSADKEYQAVIISPNQGNPVEVYSKKKIIKFVRPFLYGMSADELTSENIFAALDKKVVLKSNQNLNFNGDAMHMYFAYPAEYGAIRSIKDPNNFEAIDSFVPVTIPVTSSGLQTNWTHDYIVMKTGVVSNANQVFKFSF